MDLSDLSPQQVADALTMGGLEVEGIENLAEQLQGCVVAVITEVDTHPESKKLKVLKVHDGRSEYRIVCGAPNVERGKKVALALPGARLPNGMVVEKASIRGVESQGMLVSEIELDLVEDTWGILELPEEAEPGEPLSKWVHMDDFVLEVSPTPNRGDCFGIIGVAREVAALFNRNLQIPPIELKEELEETQRYTEVVIEDPDLCPRYTARYIEGVQIGESPLWLKVAVKAMGMRPISNVVDVTNYVMMETGHPLHAFDFERLKGGKIVVRRARDGEYIVTLDGEYRELDPSIPVIADEQRPVAIAGIMGGANSEVARSTKTVLLESAYFDPASIRRASKKLSLSTEASKRFERGTDIEGLVYASTRACQLILETAGGKLARGIYDVYPKKPEEKRVFLSFNKLTEYLGIEIPKDEACSILQRLGFRIEKDSEGLKATVPTHRHLDVYRDVDLIEEVARIWGYDRIPSTMPKQRIPHYTIESDYHIIRRIRQLLLASGLTEAITYSFISPDLFKALGLNTDNAVRLLNPLSEEMSIMRTNIVCGLLDAAARNARVRVYDIALFEIGRIFLKKDEIEERLRMGLVLMGHVPGHWSSRPRPYDFFDAKGIVETVLENLGITARVVPSKRPFLHPGQSADLITEGGEIGFVGVLHPDVVDALELRAPVVVAEVDLEDAKESIREPRYRPIPRYPETTRDLSFIVPRTVSYEQILSVIERNRPAELKDVKLIDVYQSEKIGEDRISLTLSFTFVSHEKTLSDEEVDQIFWKLVEALEGSLPIEIRGKKKP